MHGVFALVLVLALIGYSASRLVRVKARLASLEDEVKPKPSPVADAIKEMLAVAGGIYIALAALTSFLKMNIPPTITIGNLVVDPIALIAVIVTIIYAMWPRSIQGKKSK